MKDNDAKKRINISSVLITVLIVFALLFPFLALNIPKRSNIFSVIASIMPLVSFMCVYFILRHTAKKTGKSLRLFMQEQTEKPENTALVLQKVLGCSELAVLTTIYTDVVLLKKSRMGVSKSYSIYRYVGKIRTGIQLDQCKFDTDSATKKIVVHLPEPQIFDHSIDIENMEKFDEKSSLFCKITNTELFSEITRRKEQAQQRLVEHGLLEATLSRAKLEVTQLFSAMGYLGYDIFVEQLPPATKTLSQADLSQATVDCLD